MAMPADAPGFDTLSYARRLKDAGVGEKQAEAHAEAVRDAITQGVATKADIARLENKMDGLENKMDGLENKMDGMATKAELYRTMWLQTFAILGGVGLLIKLLP